MENNFNPCLQIVHISDLHIVARSFVVPRRIRKIKRIMRRRPLLAPLYRSLVDGTAPHDRFAPHLFRDFLKKITIEDAEWSASPTWLICTGDITTFGDSASLDEGKTWLQRFAQDVGAPLWLHGNHDEWPDTLPFDAPHAIASHHTQLETDRRNWPTSPLRHRVYDFAAGELIGEVQLYRLNSVLHSAWANTWARGEIEKASLEALATQIDNNASGACDLRILATHHPVHYPRRPRYQMVMKNDTDVARELVKGSPGGSRPLVHLVLSGHTHELFPRLEELPDNARECEHPDLGDDQCQLIVGTLMQLDTFQKRGDWPHQCEILRIYRSASMRNVARLERRLAGRITGGIDGRGAGIGDYQFATKLSDRGYGGAVATEVIERMTLNL
jgi:3',5'-cyclic AMP phosphodiesterase CpdA